MTPLLLLAGRLGLRRAAERPLRTGLTVVGVGAGVALVLSTAVINATLLASIRETARDLAGGAEIEVAAPGPGGLPEGSLDEIRAVAGVEGAAPILRATAPVRSATGERRVLVLGLGAGFPALLPRDAGPAGPIRITGGFGADRAGMVVSERLSDALSAGRGETVEVETPTGVRPVRITGTVGGPAATAVHAGLLALMDLDAAGALFARPGQIDAVYVTVGRADSPAAVERALRARLGGAAVVGPPGFRGAGIERTLGGLAAITSMAGTVALFVSGFVVAIAVAMALAERRRELAAALALGARRRHLLGALAAEATLLGAVAAAAGIAGGLALARLLLPRAALTAALLPDAAVGGLTVTARHLLLAGGGGLAITLGAALIQARRLWDVAPADALRPVAAYEWSREEGRAGKPGRAGRTGLLAASAALALGFGAIAAATRHGPAPWLTTAAVVSCLAGLTLLLPRLVPAAVRLLRPVLLRTGGVAGRLAADGLEANPRRTALTVGALAITAAVAVGVGGALDSYHRTVARSADAWLGAPLYVTPATYTGFGADQPLAPRLGAALEGTGGVAAALPLRFPIMTSGGDAIVLYVLPARAAADAGAAAALEQATGDLDAAVAALEDGGVVVSRLMARRHGLGIGDAVRLPSPAGERVLPVAGIFDDLISFDSLFIDRPRYLESWADPLVDRFAVIPAPGVNPATLFEPLEAAIDRAGASATVLTKADLIGRVLGALEGLFGLARGMQAAAVAVAAIVLANTMLAGVLERRWEVALQRALGLDRRRLHRAVLLEAGGIGLIGGAGAALLGSAFALLMIWAMGAQFAWRIPLEVPWLPAAAAVAGGIAVALAAGVLPSRLAGRVPLIETLRRE